MSTAGRMVRTLIASLPDLSSVVFVRRRAGGGDPVVTVARLQRALSETVTSGPAGRRWLSSDVDVRLDEVESAPAPAPARGDATEGTALVGRPWARRLVVTAPSAPRGAAVFVLHRQPRSVATEGRHPVVLLAGRVSHADQARMLAIPDVEYCLPRLTLTEDGRVVVDRSAVGTGRAEPAGTGRGDDAHPGPADPGRADHRDTGPARRAPRRHPRRAGAATTPGPSACDAPVADAVDAILAQICRDPRVATLLHDWVSDSVRP